MTRFEEIVQETRSDKWFRFFAVFCRIALAASFIPSGFVKIMGERFTGLPPNNPLGHYFDALHLTGYYYTFIGVSQIITAIFLLIPRTALLGALMYFPIIFNIAVLTYATRFEGTRIVTFMVLANLFLLVWDYQRLKHILPFKQPPTKPLPLKKPLGKRLRIVFFVSSAAVLASIIIGTSYLYEVKPGNSAAECRNQYAYSQDPKGCAIFCDCIYEKGKPLDTCLAEYYRARHLDKQQVK